MDAFESKLLTMEREHAWPPGVREAVREVREELGAQPGPTIQALATRFGFPRAVKQALQSLAPDAAGWDNRGLLAPPVQHTVWDRQAADAALAELERKPLQAPRPNLTVGPNHASPSPRPPPDSPTWAAFAREAPSTAQAVHRTAALGMLVAGLQARSRPIGELDHLNVLVSSRSVVLPQPDVEGLPAYSSPEALRGEPTTPASVVFTLGVLLYEVLSGTSWFLQVGHEDSRQAVLNLERRPPGREVPAPLEAICLQATAADPIDRFPDAASFVQALITAGAPAPELPPATGRARLRQLQSAVQGGAEHLRAELLQGLRDAHAEAITADAREDLLAWLTETDVHGAYANYIRGRARLSLVTDPPGRSVAMHRYTERDGRAWPGDAVELGVTPLHDLKVDPGSYMLIIEGEQPLRYPVLLEPRTRWHGVPPDAEAPQPIPLTRHYTDDDIPIPAGWTQIGTSPRWIWEPGFVIRRYPVRLREYLEFLESLRRLGDTGQLEACAPEGLLISPKGIALGATWTGEHPVTGVSIEAARCFARWRSALDGNPWCLPTATQWEKAARGTDARNYPWGPEARPEFAHHNQSAPIPVDLLQADSSVYGVRGMGGNVRDWVEATAPPGFAIARGGAFPGDPDDMLCTRQHVEPASGSPLVGFRLVHAR